MNISEQTIYSQYAQHAERHEEDYRKFRKKGNRNAFLRLTVFILGAIGFYYTLQTEIWIVTAWLTGIVLLFFILVRHSAAIDQQKKWHHTLSQINNNELQAFRGDFGPFDSGTVFADAAHRFAYDLDIFGKGGFFQTLNRTSRPNGTKLLAQWLQEPIHNFDNIEERQHAFQELAQNRTVRHHFEAYGRISHITPEMQRIFESLSTQEFTVPRLFKSAFLRYGLPVLTGTAIILNIAGVAPAGYWIVMVLLQWLVAGLVQKNIKQTAGALGKSEKLINTQQTLISLIEKEEWTSIWMQNQKKQLFSDAHNARREMQRLSLIIKRFEYRYNLIVGFIANSLLLWDLQVLHHYNQWHSRNKKHLIKWLTALDTIDAAISCGNYVENHPEFAFPTVSANQQVDATNLGHPLIDGQKRITNNYKIGTGTEFHIITGANMAGKSTFLRTVALNLVMAMVGLPVCAQRFKFQPVTIFTSMRTTDSLAEDESYFYAELRRLKSAFDMILSGTNTFLILDEILKGTNSEDKREGSIAFLKQLLAYNTRGIIATHDTQLGELEHLHGDNFANFCFEIEINPEGIQFDYKLHGGVTQTMNAQLLMKQMGLIPE
ncbi:MAG: hypothetical protein PF489_13115 [Salinivirgaceae bacterium]|nr:hypothetical protein [Salinivirgaceae bacterium]